jgi:hypothetical protein
MSVEEFHKPFLKNMVIVALVTVFAMVSSRYIANYYIGLKRSSVINTSFETTESRSTVK